MYGNVSFTINWNQIESRFGCHLYYIDRETTKSHTYTRVLLSKNFRRDLKEVNVHGQGSVLTQWGSGISTITNYRSGCGEKPHFLDLGIEVTLQDCRWLFQNCIIEANDHSLANSPRPGANCHRYNCRSEKCPAAFTRNYTTNYLRKNFPSIGQNGVNVVSGYQEAMVQREMAEESSDSVFDKEDYDSDYDDHDRESFSCFERGAGLSSDFEIPPCPLQMSTREDSKESEGLSLMGGLAIGVGAMAIAGLVGWGIKQALDDDKDDKKKKNGANYLDFKK